MRVGPVVDEPRRDEPKQDEPKSDGPKSDGPVAGATDRPVNGFGNGSGNGTGNGNGRNGGATNGAAGPLAGAPGGAAPTATAAGSPETAKVAPANGGNGNGNGNGKANGNGARIDAPLWPQIVVMGRAGLASPMRWVIAALALAIAVVIIANSYFQTLLNAWNQPFYDALARRDLPAFMTQFLVFLGIAGSLLTLNVAQAWLNQMTKLKLRAGLVGDLVGRWLAPMRAFRLANASELGVNPDQRMHDDARRLTELTTDLGIGLFQSSILLVVFVGVLWRLSSGFTFIVLGHSVSIPGYMVWAAFFYTGLASWLSWLVGHRLIDLNAERYGREAELRFSLVRVNEHVDAITLQSGEAEEKKRLMIDLGQVLAATRRLITVSINLTWVQSGYGWLSIVAPIVIAAPAYFSGGLTFGGMMVAVGAFNQVQSSLRWFIDNFSNIADWRATLLRVSSFLRAVEEVDALHGGRRAIVRSVGAPGRLGLIDLCLASPSGSTRLREAEVTIAAGERVLIVGDQGAGKTLLFRALAGLWPWGEGRIELPGDQTLMFIPRTPYVPPGLLKAVLAYPEPPERYADADCRHALERLGLERLVDRLDVSARWDKDLSEEDRQALAFARMLLRRPDWVVIDAALEGLENDTRERVVRLFADELGAASLILIGRHAEQDHLFDRMLHLEKVPEGYLPRPRLPAKPTRGSGGGGASRGAALPSR
jgi:putative ATP-binding cassette transporter